MSSLVAAGRFLYRTDDDLAFAEGKEDELLGRLQKKLGLRFS